MQYPFIFDSGYNTPMNDTLIQNLFRNQSHLSEESHSISAPYANASCGDEIVLHVNEKGTLVFSGSACSLTFASAEFLCRSVENEDIAMVDVGKLQSEMLGSFSMTKDDKRASCVLLPYRALEVMQSELRKV